MILTRNGQVAQESIGIGRVEPFGQVRLGEFSTNAGSDLEGLVLIENTAELHRLGVGDLGGVHLVKIEDSWLELSLRWLLFWLLFSYPCRDDDESKFTETTRLFMSSSQREIMPYCPSHPTAVP